MVRRLLARMQHLMPERGNALAQEHVVDPLLVVAASCGDNLEVMFDAGLPDAEQLFCEAPETACGLGAPVPWRAVRV